MGLPLIGGRLHANRDPRRVGGPSGPRGPEPPRIGHAATMRMNPWTLLLLLAACPGDGAPNSETTAGSTGGVETTGATTSATTSAATGPTTGAEPPPAGKCRTNADCMDSELVCVPPGSNAGECSGATGCILQGEPCVDDAGCGGTPDAPQICVADPCCGDMLCQPGCVGPDSCGPLGMCGPDARCVARTCDADAPCPANYTCTDAACTPTPCESDGQCTGVCLLGKCNIGFGTCTELPS